MEVSGAIISSSYTVCFGMTRSSCWGNSVFDLIIPSVGDREINKHVGGMNCGRSKPKPRAQN